MSKELKPTEQPEAFCDDCGGDNVVWNTPSDIWNQVVRDKGEREREDPMLCPVCFIKRAENEGIKPAGWRVAPEDVSK